MTETSSKPLIEARNIVKSFSGVQALRGADFSVMRGEIHALLGQNGAGKSTLVKILNGVHPAGSYSGTITLDGEEANFASPSAARAAGVPTSSHARCTCTNSAASPPVSGWV